MEDSSARSRDPPGVSGGRRPPTTEAGSLRSRRLQLGLTLLETARLAGISESQLSRIERGLSVPSADLLVRLEETLGLVAPPPVLIERETIASNEDRVRSRVSAPWPFVGRQPELASINAAMEAGGSAGVVLAGAHGVGKTRLAREALAAAEARGDATAWVAGVQAAVSIPFGAFAAVISLPEARVHGWHQLLRTATRTLLATTGGRRLVLGVDDAHLLDDLSASLVHHLVASRSAFVVATVRSGEHASDAIVALWKEGLARRLEVAALDWSAVMELLGRVLGGYLETTTQRELWDACRGHVLLLHELVLGGIEAGALSNEEGVWRWKSNALAGHRVSEVVQSRLRALPEEERHVVEMLAIGEPLDVRVVDLLASEAALIRLESKNLIQMEVAGERRQIRLAHPLYGEALRGQSSMRTRALMRQLADALEGAGELGREDVLRVATWRLEADEPVSSNLLTSAAQRAESLFAHELARRLAQAAVERGAGFEARLVLGQALAGLGRRDEAEELLAAVESQVGIDDQRARASLARASNLMFGLVRPADAEAVLHSAELAIADGKSRDELAALRAYVLIWSARGDEGLELAQRVLSRPTAGDRARIQALIALAAGSLNRARFADVFDAVARGLPIARRLSDEMPMAEVQLYGARWWALLGAGRIVEAAALADDQFSRAVDSRLYDAAAYLAVPYGYSALIQGRVRTALRRFSEVMPLLREHDSVGDHRLATAMLAQAAALAGDLTTAQTALAAAADPGRPTARAILAEVFIKLAQAWVAAFSGEMAEARELAIQAAEIARMLGALALEPLALHHLVRLGDPSSAVDRLAELAAQVATPLMDSYACHAAAVLAGDGGALDDLSRSFEMMGSRLMAAEAAMDAARAHRGSGDLERARRSQHRAAALMSHCEGAWSPALVLLSAQEPDPLTRREREIAMLAARGLTSKEIAEQLKLSVRTVDNHLSHVFEKLRISGRRQLGDLMVGTRGNSLSRQGKGSLQGS